MKTARILITITATALLAQTAAIAQPYKFRSPIERSNQSSVSAPASDTAGAGAINHQHRGGGGGSPRSQPAAQADLEKVRAPSETPELVCIRVGPPARGRTVTFLAEADSTIGKGESLRPAGPVSKQGGRR